MRSQAINATLRTRTIISDNNFTGTEVSRDSLQRLLAVDLVEVVFLSDDVQNLWRVLAVVGGVPLAYVLHPEQTHVTQRDTRST